MKETELQVLVAGLFQRFPHLVGFSVRAAGEELCLAAVETFPCEREPDALMGQIAAPLVDLLDEDPDAGELLRERTFARALH